MPPKGSGTWPDTPAQKRDRDRIVELVRRTGERVCVWTTYDLRDEIRLTPRLALEVPAELSRHVLALADSGAIVPVGKRLGPVEDANAKGSKARKQYVLPHRYADFLAAPPELDDLERTYYALWIASEVLDQEAVPTNAVTAVLRNVEGLVLRSDRQTSNLLITLAKRSDPRARKVEIEGERWSRWAPVGPRPDHPRYAAWAEQYRSAVASNHVAIVNGHATLNTAARELVSIAIRTTECPEWPAGRSVSLRDIRAAAGRDPRAAELNQLLNQRGRAIGAVLGDATKKQVAGFRRVEPILLKLENPFGDTTYYDLPGDPGLDTRALVVPVRGLRRIAAEYRMHALDQERVQAEKLLGTPAPPALEAIVAVRLLQVQHELDGIETLLLQLEGEGHRLSEENRARIAERRSRMRSFRRARGTTAEAEERAERALRVVGRTLEDVSVVTRPLLLPHEYAALYTPHRRGERTPAEFLAKARSLRRFDNPSFRTQTDPDPNCSARYAVDRVEAMVYAAEQQHSRICGFMKAGARLLGRDFRDSELVRLLLTDPRPDMRRAAIFALVLLGDSRAGEHVREHLLHAGAPAEQQVAGLYAALLLKAVEPEDWPVELRRPTNPTLRMAVVEVVSASRTDRWLLQR